MKGSTLSSERLVTLFLLFAVFLAFALPRWRVTEQTATADETKWVARAANFSAALSSRAPAATYQSEHPGVTTMWAGALGLKRIFPGYAAQQPGQLAAHELDQLLLAQGYTPLQALAAGRRVMVLVNALAMTIVFAYARRLLDLPAALLAAAFSAFSPFFAAHTHLMHLDGLAGSLMLLSLIAFLSYADRRQKVDLLLSGIAGGLAWLTKTPAFALGPILLVTIFLLDRGGGSRTAPTNRRDLFLAFLVWAAIGLTTYILLWPAMWTAPLPTLRAVFEAALGYAGGGHGDPVFFDGMIYEDGRLPARIFYFYPLTLLWRVTPVVLLGLALIFPALWQRRPPLDKRRGRETIYALLLYALLFTLFMTLGDKKFDRYLIPLYPALHLVAAAGWVGAAHWLAGRWFSRNPEVSTPRPTTDGRAKLSMGWPAALLLVLLAAGQLLCLNRVFPYPLSYYNPLLGGSRRAPLVMQIGWGEGLDEAGRYLSAKENSEALTVASWYRSVLAYHFHGKTVSIKAQMGPEDMTALAAADYAVIYIHQWQRDVPSALLDEFAQRQPEHSIEINGLEYAHIYRLDP